MPSLVDTLKSTVFHRRRLPLPSCTLRGLQAWRRKCCTSTAVPTAPSPASKSGLMALSSAFFIIRIIAGVASTCGNMASLNRSARCSGYTRNVWRPNVLVAAGKAANLVGERRHSQLSGPRAPFFAPLDLRAGSTLGEQRSSPTRAAAPATRGANHGGLS